MPPYVPRKRLRSASPSSSSTKKKKKPSQSKASSSKGAIAPPRKPTLFDDLDSVASPRRSGSRIHEIQDSDDDDSPLSSLSDIDFEDVPPANKRQKQSDDDDDEDEDEDIEFEDVDTTAPAIQQTLVPADLHGHISNDLELTLVRDTRISLTNDALLGRKGPTKRERQIRVSTHCVHVMLLMWHNALRNGWICDPTVQGIMLSHLPPRLWDEVDRWRRGSGLELHPESGSNKTEHKSTSSNGRGKKATAPAAKTRKGKGKEKEQATQSRESREWSSAAQRLENGAVDRSQGDPLYRLMKSLSAWWKQRFRITAPGLRKGGYMSLERLDRITKAFNEAQKSSEGVNDSEKFGERIRSLDEFRICAQECSGSRDVGEQLFTALLRGLGMEARMVASLQPLGFGWNKLEEADPEKEDNSTRTWTTPIKDETTKSKTAVSTKTSASSSRGTSVHTGKESEPEVSNSDDEILIEVYSEAPSTPKKSKPYDKDLPYPHYWTEVLSPVQNRYIAVEPLQTSLIGTNPEITVQALEPRGAKADKAKQAVSYILAYSPDGTAKDVTIRYLKGKVLPGRTKGNRLPPEKIPVYNKHGKIKRYDLRDWFKDRAMRGYSRGFSIKYPVTEADALEAETDLRPAEQTKREPKEGEETLQFYKSSKEFVLERHLKREEALLPGAKAVRYFNPKAKKKANQEDTDTGKEKQKGEPVYVRRDVVVVKSAETWHKQGRAPKPGEQPLKRVPFRAATTNRRREIAEAELATGGKVLQGLFSMDQTEWIIPDPIVDGIIPKNEYGNIDLFAEHMCPTGAVHVPYRGAVRVCKRLGVDYAEAVVDFEFGHRMAVPVIQGVVCAEEHFDRVMEELQKDEIERKRKEDEKRRAEVMKMWRKFVMGLRIVQRLNGVYGDLEAQEKTGQREDMGGGFLVGDENGDVGGGGFIPVGYELEEEEENVGKATELTSTFFPTRALSDEEEDGDEDALMIENGDDHTTIGAAAREEQSRLDEEKEEEEEEADLESGPEPERKGKGKVTKKSAMSTRPKRQSAATISKKKKSSTKAALGGLRRSRRRVASSSEEDDADEDEIGDSEADDDDDVYMDSS
ncbi:xeroderma pigmentosum group c-complementing [Rhypophila decipiens]|uniref:Xeroderma pigmentosum group c-complementing n=1 Tax=Rhypophila decipiens TaxID=261697 RepID=A0AAN6Y549_9PEZI|nr:xeroderma pigmentosum group c-complementing [Rhypophila decipiens]